jgi:RNA polymerase sigma factor (sigma-70 family)
MNFTERNQLVVDSLDTVRISVATYIRNNKPPTWISFDELMSAGMTCAIRAVELYDDSHDVSLDKYIYYRVTGACKDHMRDYGDGVFRTRNDREMPKVLSGDILDPETNRTLFDLIEDQNSDDVIERLTNREIVLELEKLTYHRAKSYSMVKVFYLYYFGDMTAREISVTLDKTIGTIWLQLHRANGFMRPLLKRRMKELV